MSGHRPPDPEQDLTEDVLVALRRIIRASDLRSRELARQTGLTTAQLIVLRAILRLGEVNTRAISGAVSLSPATVTTIMERLAERGFIERYRSTVDRRVVFTRLTAQGQRALAAAPVLLQEEFSQRFRALPADEQLALVRALDRIAAMMNAGDLECAPLLDAGTALAGAGTQHPDPP
jgi:DNA-binding MarR family transcriptional regulator